MNPLSALSSFWHMVAADLSSFDPQFASFFTPRSSPP